MNALPDHLVRLSIPSLWSKTKGAGVMIAVLDSGVSHSSALPERRVTCLSHTGSADRATTNEHGTRCTGLIAADGPRALGVAPEADVLSLHVTFADGQVSPARVRDAVRVALRRGADLISCSFGLEAPQDVVSQVFGEAIDSGVPVFGAASPTGKASLFPDSIDGVIVVGALGDGTSVLPGTRLSPAVRLLVQGRDLVTVGPDGKKLVWGDSSTSGATAVAAGVGALLLALAKGAPRRALGRELLEILCSTGGAAQSSHPARILDPASAMKAAEDFLRRATGPQ
jgi:subtilisin family serine protease